MSHAYINAELLERHLAQFRLRAHVVNQTGSTNDDLKTAARQNDIRQPTLLVAERQTAGRGTRGKPWLSRHKALFFSLALPAATSDFDWQNLPLTCGMACVCASRHIGRPLSLKWPNDLWYQNGKTGGILCERVQDTAIIGIGINLEPPPLALTTQGWRVTAYDPRGELDVQLLLEKIVEALLTPIPSVLLSAYWPQTDVLYRRPVMLTRPDGECFVGISYGIDPHGAYLIETMQGARLRFTDGSLSAYNGQDS